MHRWFLVLVLLFATPISAAQAGDESFHAGIARIAISAAVPFDALVWYPTEAEAASWQVGPFLLPANHGAPVADGQFPIVLLSHGGGTSGGTPLILSELSAALARRGFVVVAPLHGKANLSLRPLQIRAALDGVLADPRFGSHADPERLGMLGFSLGGAVTLELAGARPDWPYFLAYCGVHPDDAMSCDHAPGGTHLGEPPIVPKPLPLKAIVLLDPFAVPFPRDGLTAVGLPVLLFRPDRSALPIERNAAALRATLPQAPVYVTVPGGHFIFIDVCEPALRATAPEVCEEAPDVDRAAVHAGIERQIAGFFSDRL